MNFTIFMYGLAILLFSSCVAAHITSYLAKYESSAHDKLKKYVDVEVDYYVYVRLMMKQTDPVCDLSDEKKIELCRIIFKVEYYKSTGIYLSKIPFFKANLSCIEKDVTLSYIYYNEVKIVKQRMYPCFGRHKIIRTSFIEDDYYASFYLSSGRGINSVTVYSDICASRYKSEINVYDFILNVNFSQLDNMFIREKDVISELKLNKEIHATTSAKKAVNIYVTEQEYMKNDPICDLPYEKKITLCNLLFEMPFYKDMLRTTLNKSATYTYSMNCITKPVHDANVSLDLQQKLRDKQRMFPCHGQSLNSTENYLFEKNVKRYLLSSGPRRNSLFIYVRTEQDAFDENYSVIQIIENINISRLKSTIITEREIIAESEATYALINKLMLEKRNEYFYRILLIITRYKAEDIDKSDTQIFNEIVDSAEEEENKINERKKRRAELEEIVARHRAQTSSSAKEINKEKVAVTHIQEQKEKQSSMKNQNIVQIGSQMYIRIFENIKNEMMQANSISKFLVNNSQHFIEAGVKKELEQKLSEMRQAQKSLKKVNPKLNNEVLKLIKNMEKFIRNNWKNKEVISTYDDKEHNK